MWGVISFISVGFLIWDFIIFFKNLLICEAIVLM